LPVALIERVVLNPTKVSPAVRQLRPSVQSLSKDSYVVELLNLPDGHAEDDLHDGLVHNLKTFPMNSAGTFIL
jgi:predicted nuclease of restriction endonuclease-like (RecB) superfamily